ncbi:hypothetical protein [Lactiplantibacillus plantarum]|nr:hypothetical protein [Lactiplantibacillus plantarum]
MTLSGLLLLAMSSLL